MAGEHVTRLVKVAGRLLLCQAAAVAELAGQEARYAAMLAALQETVGQAVAETADSIQLGWIRMDLTVQWSS